MKLETQREKEIQAWLDGHEDDPSIKLNRRLPPFVLRDQLWEDVQVWRIPTKHLIFNIHNGRFTAELMAREKELNRKLDATKAEDAKEIRKLLLELNADETKALKADIKAWGQKEPGIITFDGAVINANRRLAILQQLHEETQDERFAYLNVGRLPKGVEASELWDIEAGLQYGDDFKAKYSPINELLALRDGRRWRTTKQMEKSLQGRYSESDIEKRLEVLKLIDSYLAMVNKPKAYYLFQKEERKVELFTSLQSQKAQLERAIEKGNTDLKKTDLGKVVNMGLLLVEGGKTEFRDIRKISSVARNPEAWKTFQAGYTSALSKPGPHTDDLLGDLADAFGVAIERANKEEAHEKPKVALEKALALVQNIDGKSPKLREPDLKTVLAKLAKAVAALEKTAAKAK